MISLILMKKIVSLFIILLVGYALVKTNVLKSDESKILSKISLYAISPCMIVTSFMITLTEDVKMGLLLSVVAAVITHVVFIILAIILRKIFHLNVVEEMSIVYTNSGALIIPIVSSVFGPEWVVYTSGYICVFLLMCWTHLISRVSDGAQFDIKKIILNPNIISIAIGLVILFSGIQLPYVLSDAISSIASMVGPVAMLIAGMLLASLDLKEVFLNGRAWLVTILRLVVVPLFVLVIYRFTPLAAMSGNGDMVLLISFLAAGSASANNIIQMSQTFGSAEDAKLATAINIISTIGCIASMPLLVMLYQL